MTDVAEPRTMTWPMARECPFSPPAPYRELREQAPVTQVVLPSGETLWALSRLEDIRLMLTDPRFSSNRHNPAFPKVSADEPIQSDFRASLIEMDPPEHGGARRAVLGEFTVRRMKAMQPRIQEIVDQHIDAILAGPAEFDLVTALSLPVPSLVICELLGVPYADHDYFQERSTLLLNMAASSGERRDAFEQLIGYLDKLVTAKEANPTDDLLGRQILKQRETGESRHQALVEMAFLLLLAGHETTANMTSLGVVALLENPDQLEMIKRDPGKTLSAVEELLRYFTIAETAGIRLAVEDVEIGGITIKAGDGVIALSNGANRDPESFENADEFDIERGARHHVAFGFGAHQCLGQNLARMELQIIFDTLFRRIPNLRLMKPMQDLPYKNDSAIYGLHELPVTWSEA